MKDMLPKDIYNPMFLMFRDGIGTLAYQDNWNLFDQIMVSYNLIDPNSTNYYKFVEAQVFRKSFMINKSGSFAGYPFRTFAGGAFLGIFWPGLTRAGAVGGMLAGLGVTLYYMGVNLPVVRAALHLEGSGLW